MSEERTREPAEVLQGALLELVSGARAILDVVEELVSDPSGVAKVVENTFGAMRNAASAATTSAATPSAESGAPAEEPTQTSRVTRIRVQ